MKPEWQRGYRVEFHFVDFRFLQECAEHTAIHVKPMIHTDRCKDMTVLVGEVVAIEETVVIVWRFPKDKFHTSIGLKPISRSVHYEYKIRAETPRQVRHR